MSMIMPPTNAASDPPLTVGPPTRVASIDAARALVMFAMIFVNDIAGVSDQVVPWWMRHYPPRESGMTFVDLVFPARMAWPEPAS